MPCSRAVLRHTQSMLAVTCLAYVSLSVSAQAQTSEADSAQPNAGFELHDASGERGQSVSLPFNLSEQTRERLKRTSNATLTVLGLPIDSWLSAGTATGRGWRIDGPAIAAAAKELQITTTTGDASDHLVEFQLKFKRNEQPLSRLMALTLSATKPNMERIASRQQVRVPEPVPAERKAEPVGSPPPNAAKTLEPQQPIGSKPNVAIAVNPEKPEQPNPESANEAPKIKESSVLPTPTRLAKLIPNIFVRPKPEPSGLGAGNVKPPKDQGRLTALPESKAVQPAPVTGPQNSLKPVAVPEPQAPAVPTAPAISEAPNAEKERNDPLFQRAQKLIDAGDVAGARLLLSHLANGGNSVAAFEMARTYETDFLQSRSVWGLKPDPNEAERWHAKARDLGFRATN